jgi:uncharacterized membrane protein
MKTSLADFDFLDPTTFIITCIAMFFVVMIRYFILSGFFHSYFIYGKKKNGSSEKSIQRHILQNSSKRK